MGGDSPENFNKEGFPKKQHFAQKKSGKAEEGGSLKVNKGESGGAQFAIIRQKKGQKDQKPTFFVPKRSMVFADGLEIKFYPISIFESLRLAH